MTFHESRSALRSSVIGSRFLPRQLTMIVAVGALFLAGLSVTARPAKADADDILRFLAGAIVVGAIVNAIDDNHTPRYYGRWTLPNSCLETIRVNRRNVDSYNARCLSRAGYHDLPNRCRYEFRVNGGRTRTGFIAECLYEAGYRPQNGGYGGGYYGGGNGYGYSHPPITSQPPRVDGPPRRGGGGVLLPSRCEMTYRQNGRRVTGYWGDCMRNAGLHSLPGRCAVRSTSGERIYNQQCLLNAGYRIRY